ncbi:diadenosine tetraphosphate (Ap4A) HIT family hydrolase [Pleionea mediterranea]|uniref:Diadenosine tetraphosphate (Ap4A) HIT family hydrolase n=1 Tax=Pleionea mediterranea TaxID=523701 RepID=A0A316FIK4_9GAMM|nr:diadenosine tetraphosphate (Ap4A) HIT family hydrolase [Pleionea mediterranea]
MFDASHHWVIRDAYPVTTGHTLIISKRHAETWFDLTDEEQAELNHLLCDQREQLLKQDASITGFNIGMNCGEAAGQTVMHCHIHLIPRFQGDSKNTRGGVRGVTPEKQTY